MQNEMSQSFMYASFLHFYLLCSVKGKDDLLKLCYFIGTKLLQKSGIRKNEVIE